MRSKYLTFVSFFALAFLSCNEQSSKNAVDGLKGSIKDVQSQLAGLAPVAGNISDMTSDQIQKIFVYEYKVIPLEPNLSPDEIQSRLSLAGQERWDCFSAVPSASGTNVFCRRVPYALLKNFMRIM